MALLDFLKRKKEVEKAKAKQPRKKDEVSLDAQKASTIKEVKKEPAIAKASMPKRKKGEAFSYTIVKEPHISEKATYLGEKNKYVFKVYDNANKPEIKKSIEGIYGVTVLQVNIVKIPSKKRRLGRTEGFKKGHTKAIVTLQEGQKIEVY